MDVHPGRQIAPAGSTDARTGRSHRLALTARTDTIPRSHHRSETIVDLKALLKLRESQRSALVAQRDADAKTRKSILDAADAEGRQALTAEEDTKVTELTNSRATTKAQIEALDAKIADLKREIDDEDAVQRAQEQSVPAANRPTGGARVVSEPQIYERGRPGTSYFRDQYYAQHGGDREAWERLSRSARQTIDEARGMGSSAPVQVRALTTTDGAGGEFVPPLWMIQNFIQLARPARVTADLLQQQALPGGTDTISLPRLATGTAVAEQATQNTAVQNTDATTSSISASVATIAGQQVISQQLLDQSQVPIDEILLRDLAADYAVKLDTFVLNNNATNKIGLLNVSGAISVTYTDASPTMSELWPKGADAVQQVLTNRYMPIDAWVMHPRRWAWMTAAVDTAGRPLIVPDNAMNSVMSGTGGPTPQGYTGYQWHGVPVYTDPNMPVNLGAGTNEDRIIGLVRGDSILFEGTPRSESSREANFANLSVVLRFYNYTALHASRYPKSIVILSGTGLISPTF